MDDQDHVNVIGLNSDARLLVKYINIVSGCQTGKTVENIYLKQPNDSFYRYFITCGCE